MRTTPDWVRARVAQPLASRSAAGPAPQVQRMVPRGPATPLPSSFVTFPIAGGQPLPPAVRQRMEAAFGTSFADVRVHVGPHAQSIGALAFTHGTHLHLAPGAGNPNTPSGQRILAHELAHVVQQRAGRVRNPFGAGVVVVQDALLEAEAERMARRATAPGVAILPMMAHSRVVQRAQQAPLKVHTIDRATTPEIYWLTAAAIEKGAPTTLTFVADTVSTVYARHTASQQIRSLAMIGGDANTAVSIRDVAREKVFNIGVQLPGARKSHEYGFSRDEYPYACTLECGADAFWGWVPAAEQHIQGGQLGGMHLVDGEKFRVRLNPPL